MQHLESICLYGVHKEMPFWSPQNSSHEGLLTGGWGSIVLTCPKPLLFSGHTCSSAPLCSTIVELLLRTAFLLFHSSSRKGTRRKEAQFRGAQPSVFAISFRSNQTLRIYPYENSALSGLVIITKVGEGVVVKEGSLCGCSNHLVHLLSCVAAS